MTLAEKLAATRPAPEIGSEVSSEPPLEDDDGDMEAVIRAAKAMRDIDQTHRARGRTCLIVDDSRVIRKVSSKIAASLGYIVIEAENGEEALARCRKQMPNLVLTDWQMPVMSGPEFVAALRTIPTPYPPKVVFCTSKSTAKDVHEGIRAGADDYVVKPFDEATLKAKLEKLGVR